MDKTTLYLLLDKFNIKWEIFEKFMYGKTFTTTEYGQNYYYISDIRKFLKEEL